MVHGAVAGMNKTARAMRRKAAKLAARGGEWVARAQEMRESADLIDPEHAICGISGCTYLHHRRGSAHSWETQARSDAQP